jgi:serine/tyrosine/threonine adenylyltransferase
MSADVDELVAFDNTFVRDLAELFVPWQATPTPTPRLLALNVELAGELGVDADALRSPRGIGLLTGANPPPGAEPVAMAYAGHQFGGFSPRLGDGRALLLGELVDTAGRRRDVHLKGSGRTPFSRGGDGKAAVGPMLREYLIGEAMHALGISTTRALAVVATGDDVVRETVLPGAVLTRIAASHVRVGTFQYAAGHDDPSVLLRLADYAIARHHPDAMEGANPYVVFFERVMDAQASLIARWMNVGFVHGVMNTDNMTISGETIDYGPCAFMEAYDPTTVFSSIDHGGRYAYGNQPQIAQWNLARLAETLLPLFDADTDAAIEVATDLLRTFPDRYLLHWRAGMRVKLGLDHERSFDDTVDTELIDDLLALMHAQRVDFTSLFRSLAGVVIGEPARARSLFDEPEAFDVWSARWALSRATSTVDDHVAAAAMDAVNPAYIPRNELVEEALTAATSGDLAPFDDLLAVIVEPYTERPGLERYAGPAGAGSARYQTFCGT